MKSENKAIRTWPNKEKDPTPFYLVYFSSIMKKVLRLQFIH